ncbi:unnamed protein product [Heterobilharzia americana]|nr:unnamed protein product [Heterobilharzia americana]
MKTGRFPPNQSRILYSSCLLKSYGSLKLKSVVLISLFTYLIASLYETRANGFSSTDSNVFLKSVAKSTDSLGQGFSDTGCFPRNVRINTKSC